MRLPAPKPQRGFSLVGVMIGLALGAFLLAGVFQVFFAGKQTFAIQNGLSRLQESGRSALDFMGRTIRMTSYWSCLVRPAGDLAGTNDNTDNGDAIDNGTDTITLRGAFNATQAATITGACGEDVADTTAAYYTHSSSMVVYSVRNAVLFEETAGQTLPLVEGVENLQILYGEDTDADGSANYYVPAHQVTSMDNVRAVRVSLLLRSLEDNLAQAPVAYTYNGASTTPADRRLRRVVTSTFAMRNRIP